MIRNTSQEKVLEAVRKYVIKRIMVLLPRALEKDSLYSQIQFQTAARVLLLVSRRRWSDIKEIKAFLAAERLSYKVLISSATGIKGLKKDVSEAQRRVVTLERWIQALSR